MRTVGIGVFGGMALLGLGFFVADIWSTQGNAWTALFDKSSFANLVATVCAWVGTAGIIVGTITAVARNRSMKNLILVGVASTIGGLVLAWAFFKSAIDLSDPANSESGDSWFGLGPPFVIGIGSLLVGVLLMLVWERTNPEFFKRKWKTAAPGSLDPAPAPVAGGAPLRGRTAPGRKQAGRGGLDGRRDRPRLRRHRVSDAALDVALGPRQATLKTKLVVVFAYDPARIGGEVRDLDKALERRGSEVTAKRRKRRSCRGSRRRR